MPLLRIKSGSGAARVHGFQPSAVLGVVICWTVLSAAGFDCVITAGLDGKHQPGSLHYVGCAFDLRCNHVPSDKREELRIALKTALGDDYDVVLEGDHWHVEFQPKAPYTGA